MKWFPSYFTAKPKANQQPKKKSFRSLTLDFGVNDNIDLLDALLKNQTKEDKTGY